MTTDAKRLLNARKALSRLKDDKYASDSGYKIIDRELYDRFNNRMIGLIIIITALSVLVGIIFGKLIFFTNCVEKMLLSGQAVDFARAACNAVLA